VDAFADLAAVAPVAIWDGVVVRAVHGERITLGVVELEAGSVVPEHRHENEQLGIVLRGSVSFRVADDTRDLGPGGTWRIPANTPHEVTVGPDGAVVLDVFAPTREDWAALEPQAVQAPLWPDGR
jgi:quercetin dioxygenase-like cupin family protein